MRTKPIVVLSSMVGAALAVVALYSSCGSTGGGNDAEAASATFFSQACAPAGPFGGGSCLSLQTPSSIQADGRQIGGFRARLVDGSGNPLPGVQICFAFENPGVATLIEPTNGCGLTDQNGLISGQFQAGNNTGSFALVATPQAGFGLQIRRTISFTQGPSRPSGGAGCSTGSDCESGECSASASVCGAGLGACCLGAQGDPCFDASSCGAELICLHNTCSAPTTPTPAGAATPVPVPTAVPVGGTCSTTPQCVAGAFCSTGDCAGLDPANECATRRADGVCCTFDAECIGGSCLGTGVCG